MNRRWAGLPSIGVAIPILAAGCVSSSGPGSSGGGVLLFDAAGGTTWRNHVQAVADPGGSGRQVLQGERVAKDYCQMTFVNDKGFFAVPADHAGAVEIRLWVAGGGRVRAALVSGDKLKSYYRDPPALGQWYTLTLPLGEAKGKLDAGARINDITIWLRMPEKGAALPADAAIFLDRAVFNPAAASQAPKP